MPILTQSQPENPNFLAISNFRFVLQRAPTVVYFAQEADIPGLALPTVNQEAPFGYIPRPAQRISWDEFVLHFRVDEDFRNYLEIFNWIVGIGFPDGFEDPAMNLKEFSDATLTILDSAKNPNMEVTFINMFPTGITPLRFDVTEESIVPQECSVSFKYQRFYMNKI